MLAVGGVERLPLSPLVFLIESVWLVVRMVESGGFDWGQKGWEQLDGRRKMQIDFWGSPPISHLQSAWASSIPPQTAATESFCFQIVRQLLTHGHGTFHRLDLIKTLKGISLFKPINSSNHNPTQPTN